MSGAKSVSAARQLRVIAGKEVRDNLRDRRAMTTALIMPLMGPLTLVAAFFAIQKAEHKTHAPHVPVVGRENAPELVRFLGGAGVIVDDPPADPEAAVREAKSDVIVRIPPDFGAHLRAGMPAVVEVICDPSRQDAAPTLGRVEKLLEGYGREIGAMRLMVRGIDPQIITAVRTERTDVSAPGAEKALLLGSLPLFLLMSCFVSGLYIAIDTTAGERERGSLEPLLLNPVSTTTIVLAKVIATLVFAALGAALSLTAFAIVVPAVPFADVGLDLQIPLPLIGRFVLLFAPTIALAASIEIFVGALSKNTKTAQASLGLLLLLPVLPGIIVVLFPQQPTALMCAIPALGESILGLRLLRGEDVHLVHELANAGTDLAIAAALIVVTSRLFGARMLSS